MKRIGFTEKPVCIAGIVPRSPSLFKRTWDHYRSKIS